MLPRPWRSTYAARSRPTGDRSLPAHGRPPAGDLSGAGARFEDMTWSPTPQQPVHSGFGHDTHGVENRDGVYYVQCLKKGAKAT